MDLVTFPEDYPKGLRYEPQGCEMKSVLSVSNSSQRRITYHNYDDKFNDGNVIY